MCVCVAIGGSSAAPSAIDGRVGGAGDCVAEIAPGAPGSKTHDKWVTNVRDFWRSGVGVPPARARTRTLLPILNARNLFVTRIYVRLRVTDLHNVVRADAWRARSHMGKRVVRIGMRRPGRPSVRTMVHTHTHMGL